MDAVAPGLSWPERWGEGYSLVLRIAGSGADRSVEFKPSEALTFATGVVQMLSLMIDSDVRIMFNSERVEELAGYAENLRIAHHGHSKTDAPDAQVERHPMDQAVERIAYSRAEAAEAVAMSEDMLELDRAIRTGELKAKQLGHRVLIRRVDLDAYIESLPDVEPI